MAFDKKPEETPGPRGTVELVPDKFPNSFSGVKIDKAVAVDNVNPTVQPKEDDMVWLINPAMTLMIFGPPKGGKTHAYCSYIDHTITNGGKVYIICTDGGFVKTAKKFFGEKIEEIFKGNVEYREIFSIDALRKYFKEILPKLKKKDLLIIDLISLFWEFAQRDYIEKVTRGKIENYITDASTDPKKFGLLEGSKWVYIKAMHKFVEDIIIRKPCSFIGVCTEKSTDVEITLGGVDAKNKLADLGFSELSVRASGEKNLPYYFGTILRIYRRGDTYKCRVVGDRGHNPKGLSSIFEHGKDLKGALDKWRKDN